MNRQIKSVSSIWYGKNNISSYFKNHKFTLLALWSVLAWAGTSNPTGTTCGSLTGGAAPGNIAAGFIARFAYKTTLIINGNF